MLKKLHWFDEAQYGDIEPFHAKHIRKQNRRDQESLNKTVFPDHSV